MKGKQTIIAGLIILSISLSGCFTGFRGAGVLKPGDIAVSIGVKRGVTEGPGLYSINVRDGLPFRTDMGIGFWLDGNARYATVTGNIRHEFIRFGSNILTADIQINYIIGPKLLQYDGMLLYGREMTLFGKATELYGGAGVGYGNYTNTLLNPQAVIGLKRRVRTKGNMYFEVGYYGAINVGVGYERVY